VLYAPDVARPRVRKPRRVYQWRWGQFFTGMLVVIPFVIVSDMTGADDWPFWQYLLLAAAIGLLVGLAGRLVQILTTRKKYGVWSWRPIEPRDREPDA
jgi:hypothetical protein